MHPRPTDGLLVIEGRGRVTSVLSEEGSKGTLIVGDSGTVVVLRVNMIYRRGGG